MVLMTVIHFLLDINENFPLESGWTLKSSHKYGQRGTGKRISTIFFSRKHE